MNIETAAWQAARVLNFTHIFGQEKTFIQQILKVCFIPSVHTNKHQFKEYKQGCHMLLKKNVFLFFFSGKVWWPKVRKICYTFEKFVSTKNFPHPIFSCNKNMSTIEMCSDQKVIIWEEIFLNKLKNTRIIMYLPPPPRLLPHPVLYLMGYAIFMFQHRHHHKCCYIWISVLSLRVGGNIIYVVLVVVVVVVCPPLLPLPLLPLLLV